MTWTTRIVVFVAFVAVITCGTWYTDRRQNARVDAIMAGDIRGNKDTLIYHVPTCPEYDGLRDEKIRRFATIYDAEAAGYRRARNCVEAAIIRDLVETEPPDSPDPGYDDPRY